MIDIGCYGNTWHVGMIQKVEGIDYSVLDAAVGEIFFEPDKKCFGWDADYSLRVMDELERLEEELAAKKGEFESALSNAAKATSKGDFARARTSLTAAQKLFPHDSRIEELQKDIDKAAAAAKDAELADAAAAEAKQKKAEEKAKNQEFNELISAGDKALKSGDFEGAKAKYVAAGKVNPESTAVKTKLQVIEDTLVKRAAEKAAEKLVKEEEAKQDEAALAAAAAAMKQKEADEQAKIAVKEEETQQKAKEKAAAEKRKEESAAASSAKKESSDASKAEAKAAISKEKEKALAAEREEKKRKEKEAEQVASQAEKAATIKAEKEKEQKASSVANAEAKEKKKLNTKTPSTVVTKGPHTTPKKVVTNTVKQENDKRKSQMHSSSKKTSQPENKHADILAKLNQAGLEQNPKSSSIEEHHEWDMGQPGVSKEIALENPEGVTDEVYMKGNKEITERVVVRNGRGDIFWKVMHPWGGIYYFKNNTTNISSYEFDLFTTIKDEDGNVIEPYHIDRVQNHDH